MAYRRYVRRRNVRRKTLSNYKIATRTSAKSQARQIYALKRRINYIQKRTKPEILICRRTNQATLSFTANALGRSLWSIGAGASNVFVPALGSANGDLNPTATGSANNFARLLSFTLYGNFYYTDPPNDQNSPIMLRLVICQNKSTRAEAPDEEDIFARGNASSAVYGPLQTGLARTLKVLSDRHYTLSYQRPNVAIKTKLKYLLSYYRDANASTTTAVSEPVGKGGIYVFYAVYGATFTNCSLSLEGKLAYTDA